jgi:hypothetical protein
MENVHDTPHVLLEMKDGILFGTYKKGLKMNLEVAKDIVKARLEFTGGKNVPAIIYNQGVVSMDKPARDFLASPDGTKGLKAAAMMLDSAFSSFLGNFYLSVNKPPMPVRIFTNTKAALGWIQKFVDK